MAIIEISNTKIEVTEDEFICIQERVRMNASQEVLIRNKHDAEKLSQKTLRLLEEGQKQRLNEALRDDDMMYLNSFYDNISMFDLIKILCKKFF